MLVFAYSGSEQSAMPKKSVCLAAIGISILALFWLASQSTAKPAPYWRLPVSGELHIIREFSPPSPNWLPGHRGIDLSARSGSLVKAPATGVITFADQLAGRGVVVINHGGVRSTYEPVSASVQVGDVVLPGEVIGKVNCGIGHCCKNLRARCLHWGLLRGDKYLNPLGRLDLEVVLLPGAGLTFS